MERANEYRHLPSANHELRTLFLVELQAPAAETTLVLARESVSTPYFAQHTPHPRLHNKGLLVLFGPEKVPVLVIISLLMAGRGNHI